MSTCRSSSSICDLARLLDHRRDLDARERRLPAVGGVERRQPHEPVHALLGRVEAVGVVAGDAERCRLDAGLLPGAGLEQLDLEAAPLGPAHLHPQHHLGPVLGVGAARAGVDGHERVARVVVAGEQPLLLGAEQARLDGRDRLLELGGEVRRPPRRARPGPRGPPRRTAACVKASSRRCVRVCSAPTFAAASGSSQKPASPISASSALRRSSAQLGQR